MRAAFSLLELLVALALVVAVAGLALPAVWGRTSEARLDSATRQLGAAIVAARVEAQRAGEAVELRGVPLPEGGGGAGSVGLVIQKLPKGDRGLEAEGAVGGAGIVQPWATLPAGVRVRSTRGGSELGMDLTRREEEPDGPVRIAVFMPDGSTVSGGPVYISLGERTIEITLNRWSGGASQREILAGDEGERAAPVAEEER